MSEPTNDPAEDVTLPSPYEGEDVVQDTDEDFDELAADAITEEEN